MHRVRRKSAVSKKTTTTRDGAEQGVAVASVLSGETVVVGAGRDVRVVGSNVVSTVGTTLEAGGDVTIEAATNTYSEHHFKDTRQSGAFASGTGITVGRQRNTTDKSPAARARRPAPSAARTAA